MGNSALRNITDQYSPYFRKRKRKELQNCGNYQFCRRFIKEDLAIQIIMDCRTTSAVNFKTRLGFNQHDPAMAQEQSVL